MAICPCCNKEMLNGVSCNRDPLVVAGRAYEPIPWGRERGWKRPTTPCVDCETPPDGIHHHGCDLEECPACHGQAIGCECHEPEYEVYDESPGLVRPHWCRLHALRRKRRMRRGSTAPSPPPVRPLQDSRPGPRRWGV